MQSLNYKDFGQFIAQLRKEQCLTQKQLADKIFLSDKAISKWERGLGLPDISILMPLANVLHVTTTELLCAKKIEHDTQFTVTEVGDLLSKTITLSKEKKESQKNAKQKRIKIFVWFFCVFLAELILYVVNGNSISTISESVYTIEILMFIFGIYFTFFIKDMLPVYYDENKISSYSHGPFRMNLVGITFNNSNWPHIVKAMQLATMCILVLFPLLYMIMDTFFPLFWEAGELIFTLASAFSLFIPIYVVGKKYE